jgi:hypothetical protein
VRIITQTFTDLWRHRSMMNPLRSGFYAVELLSHKVMRYLVPFFLIIIFAASALLAPRNLFYAAAFIAQSLFYLSALAGWVFESMGLRWSRLFALPQYFVLANLASLLACFKFLRGERYARWEPIRDTHAPVAATTAHGAPAAATSQGRDA